jgi:ankyrin repeat protein
VGFYRGRTPLHVAAACDHALAAQALLSHPGGGPGESFLRVHWVAVPKILRARRVNRAAAVGMVAPGRGVREGAAAGAARAAHGGAAAAARP